MAAPLAYFLSWTCYGQRLHGDERGSVDRLHNRPGTPLLDPDPAREVAAAVRMRSGCISLSDEMRKTVDQSIVDFCDERGWLLLARNVRTTHVHVVVRCRPEVLPELALERIKARGTLALRRARLASPATRLWTVHGSTRWINHYRGLYGAIAYVNDWQSGPNRSMLEEHKREVRARLEALKKSLKHAR